MNTNVYEQLKLISKKKKIVNVRLQSSSTTLGLTIKQAKLNYNNMFVQARFKSI